MADISPSKTKRSRKSSAVTDYKPFYDRDGELHSGVGRGAALKFAETYFAEAKETLKIASGYFYVSGYECTRDFIPKGTTIQYLVGDDERRRGEEDKRLPQSTRVIDAISSEILRDLGQTKTPLADAVEDLINRMKAGTFAIKDARQTRHGYLFHCKFYISHDLCMWSGSANFTKPGLMSNAEQISLTRDPDEIAIYVDYYKTALDKATDLLDLVRQCLQGWFDLVKPFHAYLLILDCLFSRGVHPLGPRGNHPAYFQEEIIARAVHQIETHRGVLLIVATGLGKTIIGSEIVRRLIAEASFPKILVLAPKVVRDNWECELGARLMRYSFYDTQLLFQPDSGKRNHAIFKLLEELDHADKETMILIDEAHFYRNVLRKDHAIHEAQNSGAPILENRVKSRLLAAANKGARIVLLTATPYGTSRENVSSLLCLLPHTATREGSSERDKPWEITQLNETTRLPVVTKLSLVDLLRMAILQGDKDPDDGRIFISFSPTKKVYLPKSLVLEPVSYSLFLQKEIQEAFVESMFNAKPIPFYLFSDPDGKNITAAADVARRNAFLSWLSSPWEMVRFLDGHCESPDAITEVATSEGEASGESRFPKTKGRQHARSQEHRRESLIPLRNTIKEMTFDQDDKANQLCNVLSAQRTLGNKTVVFVERLATAAYLEAVLKAQKTPFKVGCNVHRDGNGQYSTLSAEERVDNVQCFSPQSNGVENLAEEEKFNVLICTDADGVGMNMQDACVIVNYDLPLGADEVFQRAGRVLRMTDDPERKVYLITFVPTFEDETSTAAKIFHSSMGKLIERHDRSGALLQGRVLSGVSEEISLAYEKDLAGFDAVVHSPVETDQAHAEVKQGHIGFLHHNSHRLRELDGICLCAKEYGGAEPRMVALLHFENRYHLVCYNVASGKIEDVDRNAILDLIRSANEAEDKAIIAPKIVEQNSLDAMSAWLELYKKEEKECTRVCCIYLQPKLSEAEALRQMLRNR
jgi:hypothetical protein